MELTIKLFGYRFYLWGELGGMQKDMRGLRGFRMTKEVDGYNAKGFSWYSRLFWMAFQFGKEV